MRIDSIRVDGFGRLTAFDTGPEALPGLVVVLGPNEAGKSTLFTFLTTALYGFHPASRDGNPHVPWGSDEAGGAVRLRLEDGAHAFVERLLRSQPKGSCTVDGQAADLRNQPLPWVEHVPRTVFRQVFAITLGELAGLDAETWARIQDEVVGSMGATDLRSPRAAAEALEAEAGAIWRPSRRGNQRLRILQDRIRELRARRAEAAGRDVEVRAAVAETEALRARVVAVRAEKEIARAAVESAHTLLPVARHLARIASLREDGGDLHELVDLPEDPPARMEELSRRLEELRLRTADLATEIAGKTALVDALDESVKALLEHRIRIEHLVERSAAAGADRTRLIELDGEISDLDARLEAAAADVLAVPWSECPPDALTRIPVEILAERVARAADARGQETPLPTTILAQATAYLSVVLGLSLLVWGLVTGEAVSAALGAAVVGAGVVWFLHRRAGGSPPAHPSTRAREAAPQAPAEVLELLEGIPVHADHLRHPGVRLVSGLERIQTLVRDRSERIRRRSATLERIAALDADARRLAEDLGRAGAADGAAIARTLDHDLRLAERTRDLADAAERERSRLRQEHDEAAETIATATAESDALAEAGRRLARHGSPDGLQAARARIAAHRRADHLREELEREHPDLPDLEERIAAEAPERRIPDAEEVALTQARIETLGDEIESLIERQKTLEGDLSRLGDRETLDEVDGEHAALREEEGELKRERDRKWLIARLLREADRRFRQEHQPDLVRRAGAHMAHLTGGKYATLVVDESGDGDLFHLVGPGLPVPVPLGHPVSTGTLEQAYLSLRLAIVEHLDSGRERLPLFVDEVFVNWDPERRARGLSTLARISEERQIFLFTCHPEVAAELEAHGARVLDLGRDG